MAARVIIFILFQLSVTVESFGQDSTLEKYLLSLPLENEEIELHKNIKYDTAIDFKNRNVILKMDIYEPVHLTENHQTLPLIILFHGGGFARMSKEQMSKYCRLLARNNFVSVTIDYRKGYEGEKGDYTSILAAYRAIQDASKAGIFLAENAKKYSIDTSRVFIGGRSAGTLIATTLAYMNQQTIDDFFPYSRKELGVINNSTTDILFPFRINGIINMWGGVYDLKVITPQKAKIPVITFYGSKDKSYGNALALDKRLGKFGGCHQFYTRAGAGHGEDMSTEYIVSRITQFAHEIITEKCSSREMKIDNKPYILRK